jgi:hypothetical protein
VRKNLVIWSAGVCVSILLVFVVWYIEAGNFSEGAVSGTYTLQLNGETSTLVLKANHSFQQELDRAGTKIRSEGTWRVSGEGHIAFSDRFLKVTGREMSPAGQAYGQLENRLGLVSITLAPNPDGPTFHKKLLD